MRHLYTLEDMYVLCDQPVVESGDYFVVTHPLAGINLVAMCPKEMYIGHNGMAYVPGRTAEFPAQFVRQHLGIGCNLRNTIVATVTDLQFEGGEIRLYSADPSQARLAYLIGVCQPDDPACGEACTRGCQYANQLARSGHAVKFYRYRACAQGVLGSTLFCYGFNIRDPFARPFVEAVERAQYAAISAGEIYERTKTAFRAPMAELAQSIQQIYADLSFQPDEYWLTLIHGDQRYPVPYSQEGVHKLQALRELVGYDFLQLADLLGLKP